MLRIRRKSGLRLVTRTVTLPHFATILENPAYTHTFMAFLQNDEYGREEFLHDLGISVNDVNAIEAGVEIVGEDERQRHMRWFRAILDARDCGSSGLDLDPENLVSKLKDSGLSDNIAYSLAKIGGGEDTRRETGAESALRMLHEAGTDLQKLHESLQSAGDSGLDIRVAREAFSQWINANDHRLSAVLATKVSPDDEAKTRVRSLRPPELQSSLDPKPPDWLSPVVEALREAGLNGANAETLASDPMSEFMSIGGFGTVEELDEKVSRLFNEEERRQFLHERAAQWRKEIRLLAVLVKTGPHETTANIRSLDERVDKKLTDNPSEPPVLRDDVERLFDTDLAERINGCLLATVNAPAPDREHLMAWAGISADRLERIQRAFEKPRREHIRRLKGDMDHLREREVRPTTP